MPTVSSDINKFNKYVQGCVNSLSARGATSEDLLVHLFEGYKAASDKAFRNYVDKIELEYFDGRNITPTQLMGIMSMKYKQLMVQGRWDAPSPEDVKLMAMQAKIDTLSGGKKGGGEKIIKADEARRNTNQRKGAIPDPAWLANDTKPDPIDKVMTNKGKNWHFCCQENGGKCDGKWRVHKPSECKGTAVAKRAKAKQDGRNTTEGAGGGGGQDGDPDDSKRMKIMEALTGAMEGVREL
jgi:hypothetical protein